MCINIDAPTNIEEEVRAKIVMSDKDLLHDLFVNHLGSHSAEFQELVYSNKELRKWVWDFLLDHVMEYDQRVFEGYDHLDPEPREEW